MEGRANGAPKWKVNATPISGRHLSLLEEANVRLSLHAPVVCRSLWG